MVWIQAVDKFLEDFFKTLFQFEKIKTDTIVFRLHYKLAIWLVIFYSIFYTYVATKNPISCISSRGSNHAKVLNAVNDYCWAQGTFSLTYDDQERDQIYPGIGPHRNGGEVRSHQYYKWMYFYIIVMIVLLRIPRDLWCSIEDGRMERLVGKLNQVIIVAKDEDIDKETNMLVEYLTSHRGYHRCYSYGLAFCELLNVLVSAAVMWMWDVVTDQEFSTHGANWSDLGRHQSERTDRLSKVFPLMGKCTFYKGGHSGSIQTLDFFCLLPLNFLNEKAAIFFWYFFMFLVVAGASSLVSRFAIIISTRLRIYSLSDMTPLTPLEDIKLLTENCSYADWFVIYKMGSNLEPMVFRLVLQQFIGKLKGLRPIDRV